MMSMPQNQREEHPVAVVDTRWTNADAWHDISLTLKIDRQDKTHLSVNNA